jgi:hypothetical protein
MSEYRGRNKAQDVAAGGRTSLQWANGRTEYQGERGRFVSLVGFHVEIGKSEAFDAIAEDAGLTRITIRHPREGAPPALVAHWYLGEAVRVYPLTYGPLATDIGGATRIADRMADEAGIVASWIDRSYLGLLVLVETSAGVCPEPMVLSAKSRLTPHLYDALLAHLRMCEAADGVAGCEVPCAWIGLPLVSGDEFPAGSKETTNLVPMRADYDAAPATIDAAYLKQISLPRELRNSAQALTETALAWARETLDVHREGDTRSAAQRRVVPV